jgi:hypothetical protein
MHGGSCSMCMEGVMEGVWVEVIEVGGGERRKGEQG